MRDNVKVKTGCRIAAVLIMVVMMASPAMAQDFLGSFAPKDGKEKAEKKKSPVVRKDAKVNLPDKPNKTDAQGRRQGVWGKKYPNGRYSYVATFKDGRPVGKVKRYYPNGHFSAIITYDANSDTCRVETFHDKGGKTESKGFYVGQKREGVWNFYMHDGTLLETSIYSKGKLHGQQALYYDDGKLLSLTTWVDSLREGPYVRYFPSGGKMAEGTYHVDELNGEYKTWGSDGKVVSEGRYESGVKVGKWHVRFPDENNVECDIIYDKHGLIINKAEVDSIQNAIINFHEAQRGEIDDPADYIGNPEEYVPFKQ